MERPATRELRTGAAAGSGESGGARPGGDSKSALYDLRAGVHRVLPRALHAFRRVKARAVQGFSTRPCVCFV